MEGEFGVDRIYHAPRGEANALGTRRRPGESGEGIAESVNGVGNPLDLIVGQAADDREVEATGCVVPDIGT